MTSPTGYVSVRDLNAWIAAHTIQLPTPPTPAPTPHDGKTVVFNAPYSDTDSWAAGRTSSYPAPKGVFQTNPSDNKLDILSPAYARPTDAGVFTATKNPTGGLWQTPFVTTEGSTHAFQVTTGDVVTFDITMNAVNGAWPAVWTWREGGNELDLMEYHGDNPTTLEFTNHIRPAAPGYPKVVTPGRPSHLEVVCAAAGVQWWVDGVNVFTDTGGLPATWSAYLNVNLSISTTNQYHPGPDNGTIKIQEKISNLTVWR